MESILFHTIDWDKVEKIIYLGETGFATWQTKEYKGLRIRIVEYSSDYIADHWCKKGHIVQCLEGTFESLLETGESFIIRKGMTYVVSDNESSHKSISKEAVKLLIIDGDFLQKSV